MTNKFPDLRHGEDSVDERNSHQENATEQEEYESVVLEFWELEFVRFGFRAFFDLLTS